MIDDNDISDLSSIKANKGPIEDSIDLTEKYQSVTERYYTPYYKIDEDRTRKNDLCLQLHSNRISLVTLAPSHPILTKNLQIKEVDCQVTKSLDRKKNKAVGKGKKGGQNLDPTSILCHLETEDARYAVEAIAPSKLICMNKLVLDNPSLIRNRPDSEGHIAILLPYLGQIEECKASLLSKEAYDKIISEER